MVAVLFVERWYFLWSGGHQGVLGSSGTRVVGWRWLEMRRHSTHVDRHSRHHSTSLLEIMEAAWGDVSTDGDSLNVCWLKCCLLIEMYHDVSYDPWYLWICTTHIQPPHVQYVAWKWCVHTTYTHILICSRYFSRCQSEIIQHRTCHLEAVWACMDNPIL